MCAHDWACGTRVKPAYVRWHGGLLRGPVATQPGRLERDATGGVQPGDEAWGNQRGQLTQDGEEVSGKAGPAVAR
jgi:hypothetical protein